MERFWLKSYPPDVPAEIDTSEYRSLKDLCERHCHEFPERVAYVQMGHAMTYGELESASRAFAAWLQQSAGLEKGERIAIMLPNVLQYPVAMFGALRAGLTVVNTNPLYTAHELEHQLSDSGAQAIVILENFAHVLEEVIARTSVRTVIVTGAGDLLGPVKGAIVNAVVRHVRRQVPAWHIAGATRFATVLARGHQLSLREIEIDNEDIAFLQYTGGTTGVSKGAVLTHRNLTCNARQGLAWFGKHLPIGATYVLALPLYHIFSLTGNCLMFMCVGARGIMITNPRDFRGFVRELKKYPPNFFLGVNTLFNALLHTPGFDEIDFTGLTGTVGGGMAVQRTVAEQWHQRTGCVLGQGWGLTETSPIACMNPLGEDFNGSIGLPVPSTEISIRSDEGRDLGVEAIGEICVRGPQVMREYWKRPDETANVMLPDGWLRTGDIGHIDARGYVFIEDRKKDMIVVSGFNVYPNEVESAAVSHPGVLEAAAVAQPDEKSGESVALFVVRKDPHLTAEALIAHCRKSLTGYKVPKHVYFRSELPKTNVGKILRKALRDEVNQHPFTRQSTS
ncbi:MAG: AMP-binding protein [Gammaproteobacteria bacterium]|nr:AMP-binding protein [Gammaproteobacteria bacterium]